ncbi:Pectate lyase/Amb allergen [Corchorus olitorius]|uniref:Pectate lyase n=1 Tax=Corchorus olitorius TaxID=93759 RepID=A0A1R3I6K8_9ROSI|nr:Pectate lyase/Amb allergen [Corchorus olitorius]
MGISWCFSLALFTAILLAIPSSGLAKMNMNVIDKCWRRNPRWRHHRQQLATCSVGFTGKMTNNIGKGTIRYKVTDASDDPINPKPGTLRYGATMIKGKIWITFTKSMEITLQRPLLIGSFTAIDGRGANVHITGVGCLFIFEATDIIIHGLRIHNCKSNPQSAVMGPDGKVIRMVQADGDAIRLVNARKVWIDHNTLNDCQDGLLDVTFGSTDVTISNNWFKNQDKVMLLGHDDGYLVDRNMKVTVIFNHFGPNCNQRMPRVRHGYAHVANNLYQGWHQYAIGGSMNPSVKSQANFFIASGNKEVTWRQGTQGASWKFVSLGDIFSKGASFGPQTGIGGAKPYYNRQQRFNVVDARSVKRLTSSSGALRCSKRLRC